MVSHSFSTPLPSEQPFAHSPIDTEDHFFETTTLYSCSYAPLYDLHFLCCMLFLCCFFLLFFYVFMCLFLLVLLGFTLNHFWFCPSHHITLCIHLRYLHCLHYVCILTHLTVSVIYVAFFIRSYNSTALNYTKHIQLTSCLILFCAKQRCMPYTADCYTALYGYAYIYVRIYDFLPSATPCISTKYTTPFYGFPAPTLFAIHFFHSSPPLLFLAHPHVLFCPVVSSLLTHLF